MGEGDTVLLASSLIPGNENAVYRVINGLTKLGATVVHKGNALVHVSGHAAAGELLYAYNIVRPRAVMPIHGEVRHLVANADLARATGVDEKNIVLVEDGGVIDLVDGVPRVVGKIDASYILVDGSGVGELTEDTLTDRRILGEEGFLSVVTAVDTRSATVVSRPAIQARGVAENDSVFAEITDQIVTELENAMKGGMDDTHRLQQVVRRTIGRWVSRSLRRRPMIVPVVVKI